MKNISFGRAWKYCFTKSRYVIPLVIVTILALIAESYAIIQYNNGGDGKTTFWFTVGSVSAFAFALLKAPAEIAANTTEDQANRGVYIN